jgi:hypothetical protein
VSTRGDTETELRATLVGLKIAPLVRRDWFTGAMQAPADPAGAVLAWAGGTGELAARLAEEVQAGDGPESFKPDDASPQERAALTLGNTALFARLATARDGFGFYRGGTPDPQAWLERLAEQCPAGGGPPPGLAVAVAAAQSLIPAERTPAAGDKVSGPTSPEDLAGAAVALGQWFRAVGCGRGALAGVREDAATLTGAAQAAIDELVARRGGGCDDGTLAEIRAWQSALARLDATVARCRWEATS